MKILDAKSVQGTQFNRNLTFAENSIHDKKLKEAEENIQAAERLYLDSPKVLLMHARLLQTMGDLPNNQNFDPETGYRYAEITPRHFSFNSPQGACPVCDGLGTESVFDPALLIPEWLDAAGGDAGRAVASRVAGAGQAL